jgi:hypothetical protein
MGGTKPARLGQMVRATNPRRGGKPLCVSGMLILFVGVRQEIVLGEAVEKFLGHEGLFPADGPDSVTHRRSDWVTALS